MFGILSVHMRSRFSPKDVLRSSFYIYNHYIKYLKKFFCDVFERNTLHEIHKYVRNRSAKRPFTKRGTFRSLLRPKTRIMFTRDGRGCHKFGQLRCSSCLLLRTPLVNQILQHHVGAAMDAGAGPGVTELEENIVDVVASLRGAALAGLVFVDYVDHTVTCVSFKSLVGELSKTRALSSEYVSYRMDYTTRKRSPYSTMSSVRPGFIKFG